MKRFFLILLAITLGVSTVVIAQESAGPGEDAQLDVPRIMQVKVLADGTLLALSQEKGGL